MRKLFSFLLLVTILFSFTPGTIHALDEPSAGPIDPCKNTQNDATWTKPTYCFGGGIGDVVAPAVQILFVIATAICLGFLIYGGFRWITSRGDKESIATARATLVSAVAGLIIVFLSYVIINFALIFMTGADISKIEFSPLIPTPTP